MILLYIFLCFKYLISDSGKNFKRQYEKVKFVPDNRKGAKDNIKKMFLTIHFEKKS